MWQARHVYLRCTAMAKQKPAPTTSAPPASVQPLAPLASNMAPAIVAPQPQPAPQPQGFTAWATANAPQPQPAPQPAAPATGKGAATAARWYGAYTAANPLTAAQALALPATTVITCNVAANPKRNAHNVFVYPFNNGIKPGATTTWGAFVAALAASRGGGIKQAAQHLAWDASPKRLKGQGWVSVQLPQG